MEELKFRDMRAKKSFTTSKYEIQTIKGKRFAVTTAPSGVKSYRIVGGK